MSGTSDLLLVDARSALLRCLAARPQSGMAIVFAFWISCEAVNADEARKTAAASALRSGAQQDPQNVATLGFAYDYDLLGSFDASGLRQGLERVAGRTPFVDGIPMPFCSDAVGALGIALGTRKLEVPSLSDKVAAWMRGFVPRICEMDGTDDWERELFHAADCVLGNRIGVPRPSPEECADVRVALSTRNVFGPSSADAAQMEEEIALQLIVRHGSDQISYERAAIRLAALSWVTRSSPIVVPNRISTQDLVQLLERVPAGLRRWTWEAKGRTSTSLPRQWHIDHEYHVQNLLWSLLAPIFPDLDDEQYFAKIGQKSPRADLYIPSMRTVVEAKFLRSGERIQKMVDEISSDASLYRATGNDCDGIIPFIWDDGARSHEHYYLRQGLRKLPGVIDAVIVSRPQGWGELHGPKKDGAEGTAA